MLFAGYLHDNQNDPTTNVKMDFVNEILAEHIDSSPDSSIGESWASYPGAFKDR